MRGGSEHFLYPGSVQPRWYAPAWVTLPLAARRCCVRNPVNGVVAELSADQHAVLTACDGCHTIEHAAAVHRKLRIREGDRATISNWLGDFASKGLFLSLNALLQWFSAPAEWVAPPFAGIVIRTCDRPTLLTRVLASATTLETRVQRRYRYHILDDSRDPANRAINARIVADSALDTHYRDLASNDALVDELTRAFPTATDTIGWLLGPPMEGETTYGRPVNLALLLTAGRRVLMLDDDALLEPRAPPAADSGFSVSSAPDELFCFADQAETDHACPPTDVDPFVSHLEWLGAPAGSAWSHFANHASATSVVALSGDDALRREREDPDAKPCVGRSGLRVISLPSADAAACFATTFAARCRPKGAGVWRARHLARAIASPPDAQPAAHADDARRIGQQRIVAANRSCSSQ